MFPQLGVAVSVQVILCSSLFVLFSFLMLVDLRVTDTSYVHA
jgi:hypothetical protein